MPTQTKSPATVAQNGAGIVWTGLSSIGSCVDVGVAQCAFAFGELGQSRNLRGTRFVFSIPAGSTLNSITLTIERFATELLPAALFDVEVYAIKAGARSGANLAVAGAWPTVLAGQAYAIPVAGWTVADINSSSFGAEMSVENTYADGNEIANVNCYSITIDYTLPGFVHWLIGGVGAPQ
jgi:hypothetical protein